MSEKVALITGVLGQDGKHLSDLLISKDYKVYGMVHKKINPNDVRLTRLDPAVQLVEGDLTDTGSLVRVIDSARPSEIYNLAAQSFVGSSFSQPELTCEVTGLGVLRMLESIRMLKLDSSVKFYQASSSEMFGKVLEVPQKESTPFYPRSPYGVAKSFGHQLCVNYRESYGIFASCGILFNHEGPYRGYEFVTRKISRAVARISLGIQDHVELGNLDSRRDWGYAGDYVEAMWLMLQQEKPDDFVISTGEVTSVREFLQLALESASLEPDVERYYIFDSKMVRPAEVDLLQGDSTKAYRVLNWKPKTSIRELVEIMVQNDLAIEKRSLV